MDVGCYIYNYTYYYDAFYYPSSVSSEMTPSICRSMCHDQLMPVSLLVLGDTCICDHHVPADPATDCTTNCSGDSNSKCGSDLTANVWYASAHIPLIRPRVPVYVFDIIATPGLYLLVDEIMQLRFVVNEDSYAGVIVETLTYPKRYLMKRYLNISYPHYGDFPLNLIALNELNSYPNPQIVYVYEEVLGVKIDSKDATVNGELVDVMVTTTHGNNVTCEVNMGDGAVYSVFNVDVNFLFPVQHIFHSAGVFTIEANCSNPRSFNFTTKEITVEGNLGIALAGPKLVQHTTSFQVEWHLVCRCDNIPYLTRFYTVTLDNNIIMQFNDTLPNGTFMINQNDYVTKGEHVISMEVQVSVGTHNGSHNFTSQEALRDADLTTASFYLTSYEPHSFHLELMEGSNFTVTVDFGDLQQAFDYQVHNEPTFYNALYNHTYKSTGYFNVTAHLQNQINEITVVREIKVETDVYHTKVDVQNATSPDELAVIEFSVPDGIHIPTDAMLKVSWGDRDETSISYSPTVSGNMEQTHKYLADGYYTLDILLYNNVSSTTFSSLIHIGQDISGLTVSTPTFVLVKSSLGLTVNVAAGSSVNYTIWYGDGTKEKHDVFKSVPNCLLVVYHTYSTAGNYTVMVEAENMWNKEVTTTSVSVQDKIQGLALSVTSPTTPNTAVYMTFLIQSPGTDSCFLFDFGDNSTLVYGATNCRDKSVYKNVPWKEYAGTLFVTEHKYMKEGRYFVTVTGQNDVSSEQVSREVIVQRTLCTKPEVTLKALSSAAASALQVLRLRLLKLEADVYFKCPSAGSLAYDWNVHFVYPNSSSALEYISSIPVISGNSTSMDVPPGQEVGHYKVILRVYPVDDPLLLTLVTGYFEVIKAPLFLFLDGGHARTVGYGHVLLMNASYSRDVEDLEARTAGIAFHWQCLTDNTTCPYTSTELANLDTLHLPTNQLVLGESYAFTLIITKDKRSMTFTQVVTVVETYRDDFLIMYAT